MLFELSFPYKVYLHIFDGYQIFIFAFVFKYLEFCDNILVLEDGEVREAGDHQTLMMADGRYAQMISNYQMEQSKV